MDATSFTNLPLARKLRWIHFNGEFVTSIRYYRFKVLLYLIDSFFVEIFFDHKSGEIVRAEPLERKNKRTNFYLDQIQLPGLAR